MNPRLQPWQGCTLPLSYSRVLRTDVFYKRSRTLSSQKTACGKFSEDFHVRGKGSVFRSGRSRARLMPRVRAADQKRPRQKRSGSAAWRGMRWTSEGRPAGGAGEPGREHSTGKLRSEIRQGEGNGAGGAAYVARCSVRDCLRRRVTF